MFHGPRAHHCHHHYLRLPYHMDFPPPPPLLPPLIDPDGTKGPGNTQGTTPSDKDWEKFQDIKERLMNGDQNAIRDLQALGATNIRQVENKNGYTITFEYCGISYEVTYIDDNGAAEPDNDTPDIHNKVEDFFEQRINSVTYQEPLTEDADKIAQAMKEMNLVATDKDGLYLHKDAQGNLTYYTWNPRYETMVKVASEPFWSDNDIEGQLAKAEEYQAYAQGLNYTKWQGVYEKDGHFYCWDENLQVFVETSKHIDISGGNSIVIEGEGDETIKNALINDMRLREVPDKEGVYQSRDGRHYIWDPCANNMIEIFTSEQTDLTEALERSPQYQAKVQGFNFTIDNGIYEKDGVFYEWDNNKREFVKTDGKVENLTMLDTSTKKYGDSDSSISIKIDEVHDMNAALYDNELLEKAKAKLGLQETSQRGVFKSKDGKYYVVVPNSLPPVRELAISGDINSKENQAILAKDALVQAWAQGFNTTNSPGVYEKDGKYYVWDTATNSFKLDNEAPEVIDAPLKSQALKDAIAQMGLSKADSKYFPPGVYHNKNGKFFIWDPVNERMVPMSNNRDSVVDKDEARSEELAWAYRGGYNFTVEEGIYERYGIYYKYENGNFVAINLQASDEPVPPEEASLPDIPEPTPPTGGEEPIRVRAFEDEIVTRAPEIEQVPLEEDETTEPPKIINFPLEGANVFVQDMNLVMTSSSGIFRDLDDGSFYVWNPWAQTMEPIATFQDNEIKTNPIVTAYQQGYNFTEQEGIFEKDGIYYEWNEALEEFTEGDYK